MDGITVTKGDTDPYPGWDIGLTVYQPEFSTVTSMVTTTVPTTVPTTYKNHGDFVSQNGGGSDNAHSPIGMPVNSKSGK
jgi:hypothetical protein